jgi:transposase
VADSTECPRVVIGLDLSDRQAQVFALDGLTGNVLEEGKVATKPEVFESRFRGYERARIVLEAGTHSPWIYELLIDLGHEVLVVNPRRLKLLTESDKKSDRLDAQTLAQLGKSAPQLLSPIWNRGREVRGHLTVIRARDLLVQMRTKLVNHVRSTVKTFGGRVAGGDARSFHSYAGEDVPDVAVPALKPILDVLTTLESQIKAYDRQIVDLAETVYPETAKLQQVPGVGPITSLAFVLTIGEPGRFSSSKAVGSYLGLRPRQQDSGDSTPQLRITKGGNGYLRRLLVGSAHYVLGHFGPDSDLRRWGLALAERGGKNAKKRAVVAVARKLSVLLHRLWVTGDTYEPLRVAMRPKNNDESEVASPPPNVHESVVASPKNSDESVVASQKRKNSDESVVASRKRKISDESAVASPKNSDESVVASPKRKNSDESVVASPKRKNSDESVVVSPKMRRATTAAVTSA